MRLVVIDQKSIYSNPLDLGLVLLSNSEKILRSEKGFAFTLEAVDKMAAWSETMRNQNCVAIWQVHIGSLNEIHTCLAGEQKAKLLAEFAVEDTVRDVRFYWVAEARTLNDLQDYCIHIEEGKPSSVIPLTPGLPDRAKQALMDLQAKAEHGNAQAQFDLGYLYNRGDYYLYYLPHLGVQQDYAEAKNWYHRAAEQGHADAQFRLGDLFSKGLGVRPNYVEARKWYQLAADQGHMEAQRNIALLSTGAYGEPQK